MPSKPPRGPPPKMVLIVRGELRLTAGKAAVQVAHAAVMLYQEAVRRGGPVLDSWVQTGQKKIALVVPTLSEMEGIAREARGRGIPSVFVEDAGLTEVAPGTRTVLGLGPSPGGELDALTGDLSLL
jgi:PTH2 family peptidyl-tRNA hydrolase